MLLKLGYDLGPCGIDGDFGKSIDAAVRSFQTDHRLTVDGICGPATWTELEKAMALLSGIVVEKKYSVIISGLDLTQAKALAANYPGSVVEEVD
jgi:peptidoglycan hydrolase-like protein with peptidoglycan-binding domain